MEQAGPGAEVALEASASITSFFTRRRVQGHRFQEALQGLLDTFPTDGISVVPSGESD